MKNCPIGAPNDPVMTYITLIDKGTKMTKKHTVAIDAEHCKIGCYECDEWEDFRPFPGYVTEAELFCKYWLDMHLRVVEKNDQ